jgi:hypothetical protein
MVSFKYPNKHKQMAFANLEQNKDRQVEQEGQDMQMREAIATAQRDSWRAIRRLR